ncbi:MAG: tetratricopeptide repeat protein [Desulfotignum sp.]|nr:tetratricopeptide repeat protein [Desulfotignum sp.]MCF8126432.1 tetratricopeptide repeat protein [Desulfotignum sp.]
MFINPVFFRGTMARKIVVSVLFFICFMSVSVFGSTQQQLFEKGVQYLKQNQYAEAIEAFTELIEIDPDNPDAYKNRGVAHMKMEQFDLAIKDFEKTRQIIPDLKGLYSNLGVAWYYKSDYKKAIENYDMEISLSPDSHYAYFNRAICWAELKEYDKSLNDISKTLSLAPDFYLAHCLKGDLLLARDEEDAARKAYEKAVEVDPEQAYAKTQLEKIGPVPAQALEKEPDKAEVPEEKAPQKTTASGIQKKSPPPSKEKDAGYEIQAGAYQVKENAEKKRNQLIRKGYDTRILILTRPNKITWYLVRTGIYSDKKQAEQAKAQFIKNTGMDAFVRPRGRF